MKNDLNDFLYRQILTDINKILEVLEYQPTLSDGFLTFCSFERFMLIQTTLHKLVDELGVSDFLLDSFKVTKELYDKDCVSDFAKMFGKK